MKYILLLLLLVSSVSAVEVNDACSSRGFDHTLSIWIYNGTYKNTFSEASINITGTARKINWTSDTLIDAVIYKSGTRTYSADGGFNGTIPKTTLSNDIVFVAFCGTNQVPEFSVVGAIIAVALGICIVAFNRK